MSRKPLYFLAPLVLAAWAAQSQGTLVFDQQSADEAGRQEGGVPIQALQPMGQSFTPSLSGIDIVRLYLFDAGGGNGIGATIRVNIRSGAINGSTLGTTTPVTMGDSTGGFVDFLFPTTVLLTPGANYYLQPIVDAGGDPWGVNKGRYGYSGGAAYYQAAASDTEDLWFREGILVPEPGLGVLVALGFFALRGVRLMPRRGTR